MNRSIQRVQGTEMVESITPIKLGGFDQDGWEDRCEEEYQEEEEAPLQ